MESEHTQAEDKLKVMRSKLGKAEITIQQMEKENAKLKKALINNRDKCSALTEDAK